MPFAYDVVPCMGKPFAWTHPGRLATLATFYGMNPAPVDQSTIGSNLDRFNKARCFAVHVHLHLRPGKRRRRDCQ